MEILGRPWPNAKEAQTAIYKNIIATDLQPEDTLFVVGDAAIDEKWLSLVQLIKCRKFLVKGNYDRLSDEIYVKYFDGVYDQINIMVSDPISQSDPMRLNIVHYPSKSIAEDFNIVAHVHHAWRVQKNMLNCGIDSFWGYPVPLERVFFLYLAISKFYDQDVWVGNHLANIAHEDRGAAGTYWQRNFGGSRDGK